MMEHLFTIFEKMPWIATKSLINQKRWLCLFLLTGAIATNNAVTTNPNKSAEYVLRQELIKYDPAIRPVESPQHKVNVSFSAKIISIIGLDNKKQMVTTKLLITQSWRNPFLAWKPADYGGIDRVRLSYKEVWVPDISLQNIPYNPSSSYTNLPLYKNWVIVDSNGTNVWKSLEMIDSECELKVFNFPFDKQTCSIDFASESYDSTMLGIDVTGKLSYHHEKEMEDISSGELKLTTIELSTQEVRSDPMSPPFIQVTIQFKSNRLISFYLFYYIVPCGVLAMLMFTTFIIPPENGERIGFCSSLLIALSVYLLLFSELLPNSRDVSLMGIFFVVVYLETALALLATVLVLKAFHANSPVPKPLKCLYGRGIKKKSGNKSNKNKLGINIKKNTLLFKNKVTDAIQMDENNKGQLPEVVHVYGDAVDQFDEDLQDESQEWSEEDHQRCWCRIARSLDRFFFWFFLIVLLLSVFYIVTKSNDIVKMSIF